MAQKTSQVSGKKPKIKPVLKVSAKSGSKPVKVVAQGKRLEKPMSIFAKAKSMIEKATVKPEAAKKSVVKSAPVAKAVLAPKVVPSKTVNKSMSPDLEKAHTALVKETKVAAAAPMKAPAKSLKTPPIKPGPAPAKSEMPVKVAAPVKAPKAAKEPRKSRKISMAISANEAASALSAKWNSLYKKAEQIAAQPYNMRQLFEEKTAIVHKVLGWGYILANRNDRLEVLFKDGIKYLISNYKP